MDLIKWLKNLIEYIKSKRRYKRIVFVVNDIEKSIKGETKDTRNWKEELSHKKRLTLAEEKRYRLLIQNFKIKCAICNKIIGQGINSFKCRFCNIYHCDKHRLPEEHKCTGEPTPPKDSFIERHENGKIIASG